METVAPVPETSVMIEEDAAEARLGSRVGALGGFGYNIIMLVAWVVCWKTQFFTGWGSVESNASAQEIARWYHDHQFATRISCLLFSVSLAPYMFFLGRLTSVLRAAEGRRDTFVNVYSVAAAGGLAIPVMYFTGFWIAAYRPEQTDPSITQLGHDLLVLPATAGGPIWGAMFLAVGVIVLRSGALPRGFGTAAIVVAGLQFLYLGAGFTDNSWFDGADGAAINLAFGSYMGWIFATSVYWWRSSGPRTVALSVP